MKSIIQRPACQRCGYRYTPKAKTRVLVFKGKDGDYAACQNCIAEYGAYCETHTEEEQKAFLETFRVKEKGEVGENNVRC